MTRRSPRSPPCRRAAWWNRSALVATAGIRAEIELLDTPPRDGLRAGRTGGYDVELVAEDDRVLAVLVSPWIFEHLTLYARKLWSRRP